jgi:hypothetical protein
MPNATVFVRIRRLHLDTTATCASKDSRPATVEIARTFKHVEPQCHQDSPLHPARKGLRYHWAFYPATMSIEALPDIRLARLLERSRIYGAPNGKKKP